MGSVCKNFLLYFVILFVLCVFFFQLVFAWEAYEKGADVHLQADPTKLELLHKEYRVKKGDFEQDKKLSILDKVLSPRS